MCDRVLLMWLESPLQSWGCDSKFNVRCSLDFPTKSGILGLIACAMGLGGPQNHWLADMRQYPLTVLSFKRKGESLVGSSVSKLNDFQTIGTHYDPKDPWEDLMIPKTVEGKSAVGGGTKIINREYLLDACFGVLMLLPEEVAETVKNALILPHWDIYFGRKCCQPTDMIFRGLFSSTEDAEAAACSLASEKGRYLDEKIVEGSFPDDGEILYLRDVPLQFGQEKRYIGREVTIIKQDK